MTVEFLQLESSIRIAASIEDLDTSDVSLQVESLTIITERQVITAAPTFGLARSEDLAGPISHALGIRYRQAIAGTSLGMLIWETAQLADPVLWFAARFAEGISGPDNAEHVGQFRIMSASIGGEPGALRTFDATYPIVAGSYEMFEVAVS